MQPHVRLRLIRILDDKLSIYVASHARPGLVERSKLCMVYRMLQD